MPRCVPLGSPMHQLTYDDPETYSFKYKWALESGFRGVGFWMADATDGNQEAIRDMWGAVPPAAAAAAAAAAQS